MGYLHIENLYRCQDVLLFKECYALEKIHGTSAHIAWKENRINLFPGGEKHERFASLFDLVALEKAFTALGHEEVTVFGEAYGGSCQKMAHTYGDKLRFIAFDVKIGVSWLAVPAMAEVATALGLEVVHYDRIVTDLAVIDKHRDAPSEQAKRLGLGSDKMREGIILRPLIEVQTHAGDRVIAKHKRDDFKERETAQKVADPALLKVLEDSAAIAKEWVTPMRLAHVLDKLPQGIGLERTRDVVNAMIEDVCREAKGEIVESKEALRAIGRRAADLFKAHLKEKAFANAGK